MTNEVSSRQVIKYLQAIDRRRLWRLGELWQRIRRRLCMRRS
jgi:hypothetical protein